jgi:hypothetical protein
MPVFHGLDLGIPENGGDTLSQSVLDKVTIFYVGIVSQKRRALGVGSFRESQRGSIL